MVFQSYSSFPWLTVLGNIRFGMKYRRDLTAAEKDAVATKTPLWFYVLREAELNNGKLKGVGAQIVAETFHRAMEGSRFSIVRNPEFRPSLGRNDTTFEMTDLLFFAFAGKKTEINPLGGA